MTIDSHTIIAKQKCNDQIWMTGREILQEITDKTVDLNLMNNNSTTKFEQLKEKSCKRSPSNN